MYDDWFETVTANEEAPPEWTDLCVFNKFQVVFDDDTPKPVLAPKWNEYNKSRAIEQSDLMHQQEVTRTTKVQQKTS